MSDLIISALVIFGIGMGIRALVQRRKRNSAPPTGAFPTSQSSQSNTAARVNFCPQCGTPINPDSTFCANCGAKLE